MKFATAMAVAVGLCVVLHAAAAPSAVEVVGSEPDDKLQAGIDPWNVAAQPDSAQTRAWAGGDVGYARPLSRGVVMWLFGDTLGGHWNGTAAQRIDGWLPAMPHSSVGLYDAKTRAMSRFVVRPGHKAFAHPPFAGEGWDDFAWGMTFSQVQTGRDRLLMIADHIQGDATQDMGFLVNGSWAGVWRGVESRPRHPLEWTQEWVHIPTSGLNVLGRAETPRALMQWSAALHADAAAGWMYLMGYYQDPDNTATNRQLMSRAPLADVYRGDWAAHEVLRADGTWMRNSAMVAPDFDVRELMDMFGPSVWHSGGETATESSFAFSEELGLWYMYTLPFQHHGIEIRFAESIEGPYLEPQQVYDIPWPQNDERAFCYAVKSHPWMAPSKPIPGADVTLALTYVCNTMDVDDLFIPEFRSIYVPQIVRVGLSRRV